MSNPLFSSMSGIVENCDGLLVGSKGIYIGDYKGGERGRVYVEQGRR